MPKPKFQASNAMLQRMAALEKQLGRSLVVRAAKVKIAKVIGQKRNSRKAGLPAGPSPNMKGSRGRLGLGSGMSGATSRRGQTVHEDEYIGDINGSVTFATSQYNVNPGQAATFPWGSRISQLYEEYDFEMLEFYYKREVSEFATNGQAGKVILSFDYDASDTAPTTKQQVEDTVPHVDGMPCTPVLALRIDCARVRKNPAKYVRPGAQPANTDIKTYDCGVLSVSTQGNTNTSLIGELHVRYRVRLSEPVLESSLVQGGVVHFSGITPTTLNNFATAVLQSGGTPALTGITAAADVITFPAGIPGNYLVYFAVAGSTSATVPTLTPSAGASAFNITTYGGVRDSNAGNASAIGGANVPVIAMGTYTIATTGGLVTVTPSTLVGGNAMDLFIVSLPASVLTLAETEQQVIKRLNARLLELETDSLSSSSYRMNRMYAKLVELGVIEEEFESPVTVTDDDGVIRVSQARDDHQPGTSTSAPPRINSAFSKLLGLK
jgi:hypothetical protein